MKPIIERMLAFPAIEIIRESVITPEEFHTWLSNKGTKHKPAIIQFHLALVRLFNGEAMASRYFECMRSLVTGKVPDTMEAFLNDHADVEAFLNENLHCIEAAAIDFLMDYCLLELDKNFDYEDAARRTIKIQPLTPAQPKMLLQTPKQITPIKSSETPQPPKASFTITDKLVRFIESASSVPITSMQMLEICGRLEKLANPQRFGFLLELYKKLAVDPAMAETICQKTKLFNYKWTNAENCYFIKEYLALQMSLLVHCGSESIKLFSRAMMQYLEMSRHEVAWWKNVYAILNENSALKANQSIEELLIQLKKVKPNIDKLDDDDECDKTESDGPTPSINSQSSQDQPPAEDDGLVVQECKPPLLLRTTSGTEVRRVTYARQSSMTEFDWQHRYTIHGTARKRVIASTSDNPTVDSESKRNMVRN